MSLQTFHKQKTKILLQQYIEAGAKDVRAIVIDGKVVVAMLRESGNKKDIRANVSLGGKGSKIELSDADKDICIRAAQACGLEVAGVDLIKNSDGTSYIIEVNSNFGLKIEKITGFDVSTHLIQYCERNYKKGNIKNISNSEFSFESMIDEILQWKTQNLSYSVNKETETLFRNINLAIARKDNPETCGQEFERVKSHIIFTDVDEDVTKKLIEYNKR